MMKLLTIATLCIGSLVAEEEPAKTEHLKTSEEHFNEGLLNFQASEYTKALESFERAELESKDLDRLRFNRGLCHLALMEYETSEEMFNKVLASQDPNMQVKAHYNLGHLHFLQCIKVPTEGEPQAEPTTLPNYDIAKLEAASFAFRDVIELARRYKGKLNSESLDIVKKAEENTKLIAAKYIYHEDQLAKSKGRKTKVIQGKVNVNGRPAPHAFIYLKSKWEDSIYATTRSDESGGFKFPDLEVGKYQLASVLYEEDQAERLDWGEDIKLPSFETDNHDLEIKGAMTLAMPYQSQSPSLETPWDDHLRFTGSQSIVSSTDWGELVDGRPIATLPEDNDFHQGYVAFDVANLQLAMAMPTVQEQPQQPPQQGAQQSTEPTPPPTYQVTLKGFQDFKDVHFPEKISIFGMKEGEEKPTELYSDIIQSTQSGLAEWKSEPFVHKDYKQLMFSFSRSKGKRMSFHEIEVYEDRHEEQDPQENEDQQEPQDDQQNQDQNQDQQQPQDQPEEPQERESRSVRNIMQKIKKKNEEAKEKQKVDGVILHTDKDY